MQAGDTEFPAKPNVPGQSTCDSADTASWHDSDSTLPPAVHAVVQRQGGPNRLFGNYEILAEIARGGMGVVYKARQRGLNRLVALKMILAGELADEEAVRRFRTEAEAAAGLRHPGIVAVYEVGEHAGQHFFSMEYVEGNSLAAASREKPFTAEVAAKCVQAIAEAIHYAHDNGILHRDLKPSNVLIDTDGRPRVTDFGLAKFTASGGRESPGSSGLTHTHDIMGTPSYMPPEQAAGRVREVGRRSDVYSLGALLYELLTGRPPFRADTPFETVQQVLDRDPVPPRLLNPKTPRNLETICLKCLEKDPARRYASAKHLADELDRFVRHEPILARPIGRVGRSVRWCRRKPLAAFTMSLVLLVVVLLAVGGPVVAMREGRLRSIAQHETMQAKRQTRIAEVRRLVTEARSIRDRFPIRSSLLALQALRISPDGPGGAAISAENELRECLGDIGGWCLPDAFGAMAVSSDGHWLVTGGNKTYTGGTQATVRLWNLGSSDPRANLLELGIHSESGCVAFSRDSHWLAVGSWDVRVFDLTARDAGKNARVLRGHHRITCLEFSLDGRFLFTTGGGDTVQMWAIEAAGPPGNPKLLHAPEAQVTCLATSLDGRWLIAGSADKTARLWNLASNDPSVNSHILRGDQAAIHHLALSPDGRWLVTECQATASRDTSIRLWDLTDENAVETAHILAGNKEAIHETLDMPGGGVLQIIDLTKPKLGLAFSADGHWLVSEGEEKTLRLWNLESDHPGAASIELRGHQAAIKCVAVSPDGHWLVSGGEEKTARLWNLESDNPGAESIELRGHQAAIKCVAVSPDGHWLVTGSQDRTARIWDLTAPNPSVNSRVLCGHDLGVEQMTITPDAHWLLTGSHDGNARIWDLTALDSRADVRVLRGHQAAVGSIAISPDARTLVTGSTDGTIRIWDLGTSNPSASSRVLNDQRALEADLAISADGRWLSSTRSSVFGQNGAIIWDLAETSPDARPRVLDPADALSELAVSRDARWAVTAKILDNSAQLWDLSSGDAKIRPRQLSGHLGSISKTAVSPDGHWLATGSEDMTVRLWDLTAIDPGVRPRVLSGHENTIKHLTFSSDGHWLATGSDSTVRLWDLTAVEPGLGPPVALGHGETITGLAISSDERWLITDSPKSTRIWDLSSAHVVASSRIVRSRRTSTSLVAFSADGRWRAEGNGESAKLWDLTESDGNAIPRIMGAHESRIRSLAFSPDGSFLVTGGEDTTVRIHDIRPNRIVATATTIAGRVLSEDERQEYQIPAADANDPSSDSQSSLRADIHDILPDWPTDARFHKRMAKVCRVNGYEFGASFHEKRAKDFIISSPDK